jgi:hypothetical protein
LIYSKTISLIHKQQLNQKHKITETIKHKHTSFGNRHRLRVTAITSQLPALPRQSGGLTRGTRYTDQRHIIPDHNQKLIKEEFTVPDVSTFRSLFQIFHPLPSFTDLPLSCSRLNQGSEGSTNSDVYTFSRRTNEKKDPFIHTILYVQLMEYSLSPVDDHSTPNSLLSTPYPWFIISLTPYNSVTS